MCLVSSVLGLCALMSVTSYTLSWPVPPDWPHQLQWVQRWLYTEMLWPCSEIELRDGVQVQQTALPSEGTVGYIPVKFLSNIPVWTLILISQKFQCGYSQSWQIPKLTGGLDLIWGEMYQLWVWNACLSTALLSLVTAQCWRTVKGWRFCSYSAALWGGQLGDLSAWSVLLLSLFSLLTFNLTLELEEHKWFGQKHKQVWEEKERKW